MDESSTKTLIPGQEDAEALADFIPKLSGPQRQFLVHRAHLSSNTKAAKAIGLTHGVVNYWKRNPAFAAALTIVISLSKNVHRALAISTADSILDLAVSEVAKLIQQPWSKIPEGHIREKGLQIRELLKGRGIYNSSPETQIGLDNRVLNIFVIDKETKELLVQVKERTGKLIDAER